MTIDAVLVLVTAPGVEKAAELARAMVEKRLAACGNVLPVERSIYWWEGSVQEDREALIVFKTERRLFEALRAELVRLHPYDCPEVLQVSIEAGHSPYLEWIRQSVRQ